MKTEHSNQIKVKSRMIRERQIQAQLSSEELKFASFIIFIKHVSYLFALFFYFRFGTLFGSRNLLWNNYQKISNWTHLILENILWNPEEEFHS